MGWKIEFDPRVEKHLRRTGPNNARRILSFLRDRVAGLEDPRALGKSLKGSKTELWRYRVGPYRIICMIEDSRCVVLVVRVGHQKDIYR